MEENIETCGWFVFYKDQLLIEKKNGKYTIPFGTEPPMPVPVGSTIHTIGEIEGHTARTFSVHAPVPGSENDRHLMMDLRSSYDVLPWEEYNLGGKAFQILNWDKNSRYCPMCGVPTVQISPIAKKCPQCRQEIYPRISPAIIVLIRREDSILLVHARNFRGTFNGLVAGFLEPGETLEECVHREVLEETGLHIKNLNYFGSQPWPYPSGIMIGFTADYESGNIKLQQEELNAIQWTPGVGEPQGGSPKWYDLYKKILAGGKSIMACWVTLDELKPLLDNIGADGVHLEMDFHNEREVEQAMRIVEEYSSSSSDVSPKDLSKEEAAATKQETIVVKDSAAAGNEALKPLFNAIVDGKLEPAVEVTKKAIAEGVQPQEIINNYMIKAMGEVGQRFQDGKAFVPQLLMAGRAMKGALELLKPLLQGSASTTIGKVVIGTVKGDLHDIGKNLVASMLEGCGFEVINIGIDVSCDKFVEEVKKNKADILCMSALLTTTMTYMQEVINALEAAGIRHQVKVMIGGAPVSQGFADEIGADGYSDNANTAVAVAKELMGLHQ